MLIAVVLPDQSKSLGNPKAREPEQQLSPVVLSDTESDADDGFNDGEDAYNKFKNRKSLKRKRSAARIRKEKGKVAQRDAIVGRRPAKRRSRDVSEWAMREHGEAEDEDEALMENTLPDYVRNRRSQFEEKQKLLKEAGLKLPPSYDDVEFSDDERLGELREKPDIKDSKPPRKYEDIQLPYSLGLIPAPIAQWLRDYQVDGVSFLHELFVYQKGGILGDDMGLGKTVQVIAFLTAAYGKTGDERDRKRMRKMRRKGDNRWYPRTLIVCPGTLIENWKSELHRWGWWHVEVYHGDTKEAALQSARSGRVEIILTTYTTYRINKGELNLIEWDCVVADECHVMKEKRSETAQSMNEINCLCRIGLTGTAIQNKYEELWTLLNWTVRSSLFKTPGSMLLTQGGSQNPGKFGPISTWKTTICEPLKVGQSHDATVYQLSKARKTAKKLVTNLLPPFFLRRMKTLIAHQLPKKSDRVVFCPLTDTQAEAYENFLDSDVVKYIKTSSDMCHCGSGKKSGWCCNMYLPSGQKWQSHVSCPVLKTSPNAILIRLHNSGLPCYLASSAAFQPSSDPYSSADGCPREARQGPRDATDLRAGPVARTIQNPGINSQLLQSGILWQVESPQKAAQMVARKQRQGPRLLPQCEAS
jgi:SNF2 family DNA or RNA helicase